MAEVKSFARKQKFAETWDISPNRSSCLRLRDESMTANSRDYKQALTVTHGA